jgi:multisubunit Na+/H+ antiporter MnhF subunit
VVAVAQTIIDIDAVMIEFLHASTAYHTVKGPRRLDNLAIEAEILQVNVPIVAHLEQIYNTEVSLDVAWVRAIADKVEYHREEEEYDSDKA